MPVSAIFLLFSKWYPLNNYEKCFSFHLKNSFRSRDIQIVVFDCSSLLPLGHCIRGWLKINLKVYDVINCLNKNLITRFIWYIENKQKYDIETLSIDRVLNRSICIKKTCRNMHQMLIPGLFLILVNNLKQPLHARSSFTNQIFWMRIIKKL